MHLGEIPEERAVERLARAGEALHLRPDVGPELLAQPDHLGHRGLRDVPEQPDLRGPAAVLPEERAGQAVLKPANDEFPEDGVGGIASAVPPNLPTTSNNAEPQSPPATLGNSSGLKSRAGGDRDPELEDVRPQSRR